MHKRLIIAASVMALATATSAPAHAAWGCMTRSSNGKWTTGWNGTSKADIIAAGLAGCRKLKGVGCYTVDCDPNINTEADADAKWPPPSAAQMRCNGVGQPKCR